MKKKHHRRCFGVAVRKIMDFRYKTSVFLYFSEFLNEKAVYQREKTILENIVLSCNCDTFVIVIAL